MRHRVDPDALFGFVLNRWGLAVAAQVCPEVEPERPAEPVMTAPADDPRRLTEAEVLAAYHSPYGHNESPLRATGLRAVADAQLAKARVTISSEDINAWYCSMRGGLPALTALLRRNGVEVTA